MTSVKRRDIGIAGALIVLAQAITSSKSADSINLQIEELKKSFIAAKIEREQFFVRKEELKGVVTKLDKLEIEIAKIGERINYLGDSSSIASEHGEYVSCDFKPKKAIFSPGI